MQNGQREKLADELADFMVDSAKEKEHWLASLLANSHKKSHTFS